MSGYSCQVVRDVCACKDRAGKWMEIWDELMDCIFLWLEQDGPSEGPSQTVGTEKAEDFYSIAMSFYR